MLPETPARGPNVESANSTFMSTNKIDLAAQFINSTDEHIFLTGKAGTGKTTFLHQITEQTHKNAVVVAPTGIAALNAGGVTIHSQFQLPLGSYLPEPQHFRETPAVELYTARDLARRHPINSTRKKVLRSLDLLIIDEVSMLRADLLDAVDQRLRAARQRYKVPFGGAQLLLIGDLLQLPPIVKDQEWSFLRSYYRSIHFFESRGLKQAGLTYLELDKIFRQSDSRFIELLNALRNDNCEPHHLQLLNERVQPNAPREEGMVTLTTHNHQAQKINEEALKDLPGPSQVFEAHTEDDYPEKIYPIPSKMELRVGAQVMFIKNHQEGDYYNGKIATVSHLNEAEDEIWVDLDGESYQVSRNTWENKRYVVSSSKQELKEEVLGRFSHFPLKLAWGITVHKSQGLTFEKAILDLSKAFAPGQVYVALSRLTSLEGLILSKPVPAEAIQTDETVQEFSQNQPEDQQLNRKLKEGRMRYLEKALLQAFDLQPLQKQLLYTLEKTSGKSSFEDPELEEALPSLEKQLKQEETNTRKFQGQLQRLLHNRDFEKLQERLHKGGHYYDQLLHRCQYQLLIHRGYVSNLSGTKKYNELIDELDQLITAQRKQISRALLLSPMFGGNSAPTEDLNQLESQIQKDREELQKEVDQYLKDHPKSFTTKTGKKKGPRKKGQTVETTHDLWKKHQSAEKVAEERSLAVSTIHGHLAQLVEQGHLRPKDILETGTIAGIAYAIAQNPEASITKLRDNLDAQYSHGEIRIVKAAQVEPEQKEEPSS